MIWRGIAIGVIISAPMGPVGILCIQRTLDKGRKAGFYTGVGAAISDLFYCLLTGFGLSFIEEFLERNSSVIQLAGSAVLIAFGVYLFRKKYAGQFRPQVPQNVSAQKNVLAGFLFTFSNPLILFLIIGLFARFNFLLPEIKFYHYMVGFLFIFVGALGWWWFVTFSIDKVRARFNLGSMIIINRVIGSVILLFAIVGIAGSIMELTAAKATAREIYLNPRRGFGALADTDTLHLDAGSKDFEITAKITLTKPSPWGMWIGKEGRGVRFDISQEEIDDGISLHPAMKIRATDNTGRIIAESSADIGKQVSSAENYWRILRTGNEISFHCGHHGLKEILSVDAPDIFNVEEFSFIKPKKGNLTLHEAIVKISEDRRKEVAKSAWSDEELLAEYLEHSEDPAEGYWCVLDRSLEESLLRMGGDYRLAMVKAFDGYDLVYLEGARTCASAWTPGMRKAHLSSTDIDNVWNVAWTDAEGVVLENSVKGQFENATLLTIQFPYQNSTLRLAKIGR